MEMLDSISRADMLRNQSARLVFSNWGTYYPGAYAEGGLGGLKPPPKF